MYILRAPKKGTFIKLNGPVPVSLVNLESLEVVNLTNNFLQGPIPNFNDFVFVDMTNDTNSFCLPKPGDCDPIVDLLLSIVKWMGYPRKFSENWKGNNPCADWLGITCKNGNITVINFENMGLTGTISLHYTALKSMQRLVLANNNLTGSIPDQLATLTGLMEFDVSNNKISGKIPGFGGNMIVKTDGNPDIGKDERSLNSNGTTSPRSAGSSNFGSDDGGNLEKGRERSQNWIGVVVFSVIGGVFVLRLVGVATFCLYKNKQKRFSRVQSPNAMVIHPCHSGLDNESVKITVAGTMLG